MSFANATENAMLWNIDEGFIAYRNDNMILGVNQLHYHTKVEIYLLIEGDCEWFVDEKTFTFKSGDIAIIPPRLLHNRCRASKIPLSRYIIYCDASCFPSHIQELLEQGKYYIGSLPKSFGNIEELFCKIQHEHDNPDEFSDTLIKSHLANLAALLFRAEKKRKNMQIESENDFIQTAISYIKSNYSSHITLDDVAKQANVSETHLSRSFKRETSFKFNEYLMLYRLKKSESMLTEYPDKSILEIAYDCGFNDSNYFSTRFKKVYGVTPSQLRQGAYHELQKNIISL